MGRRRYDDQLRALGIQQFLDIRISLDPLFRKLFPQAFLIGIHRCDQRETRMLDKLRQVKKPSNSPKPDQSSFQLFHVTVNSFSWAYYKGFPRKIQSLMLNFSNGLRFLPDYETALRKSL